MSILNIFLYKMYTYARMCTKIAANIAIFSQNPKFSIIFLYFCTEKSSYPSSMALSSANILTLVSQFMAEHCLVPSPETPLYVALSGGPDSVALLHILHRLGHPLKALHCNFHLRGEESDRDQHFCENLCARLGIELLVREFDTYAYMEQKHLSLEMAARELRYAWWNELLQQNNETTKQQNNARIIALGHHQDDSIETLLINLMRGTGLNGLTGIVAHNAATHVIRPLLCLSRQQILDYLQSEGLSYVTDSTNLENDTLRNQIRNQLLPLMQQMVPQTKQGIAQTISHLQEIKTLTDITIEKYVSDHFTRHETDGFPYFLCDENNKGGTPSDYLLRQYFKAHGFDWQPPVAIPFNRPLPDAPLPDPSRTETIDADKVILPLTYRRWQPADRIAPLGMNGHTKLVSDLFSNAHYCELQKRLAWMVCDATGQIIWIPGLRLSDHVKRTSATQKELTIQYGIR